MMKVPLLIIIYGSILNKNFYERISQKKSSSVNFFQQINTENLYFRIFKHIYDIFMFSPNNNIFSAVFKIT